MADEPTGGTLVVGEGKEEDGQLRRSMSWLTGHFKRRKSTSLSTSAVNHLKGDRSSDPLWCMVSSADKIRAWRASCGGPGAHTENGAGLLRWPRVFHSSHFTFGARGRRSDVERNVRARACGRRCGAGGLDPRTLPGARAREDGQTALHTGSRVRAPAADTGSRRLAGARSSPASSCSCCRRSSTRCSCAIWMLKLAQTALGVSR